MILGYLLYFIICFIFSFFLVHSVYGFYKTYRTYKGTGLNFTRNGEYARYTIMFIISMMFGVAIFGI